MAGASFDGIDSLQSTIDDIQDDWGSSGEVTWVVGTSVDYGLTRYWPFGS